MFNTQQLLIVIVSVKISTDHWAANIILLIYLMALLEFFLKKNKYRQHAENDLFLYKLILNGKTEYVL